MSKLSVKKTGQRNKVVFQALLLGGFTLLTTSILSFVDWGTRDEIRLRAEEDLKAIIAQVIASDLHDNDLLQNTISINDADGIPVTVYQATKNGSLSALAYAVSAYGYSGKITSIMAINPHGEILAVRILSHTETPGLGDKIEIAKDDWIEAFSQLSFTVLERDQWAVKQDGGYFDQFSGATITPRAVVKSVKSGLEFFFQNQAVLLTIGPQGEVKPGTADMDKLNTAKNEPDADGGTR